jgi:hypothetical protein
MQATKVHIVAGYGKQEDKGLVKGKRMELLLLEWFFCTQISQVFCQF